MSSAGVILVTGLQAAGKSTIGARLAARCERAAFIEGGMLWKMVVSGREDMSADPSPEARGQYELRVRNGALLADSFSRAGITSVHADFVIGDNLARYTEWVTTRPLRIVMLTPRLDVVMQRESGRSTDVYRSWIAAEGSMGAAVERFSSWLDETPRLGLWIDTSDQSPDETVDHILAKWDDALVA